MQAAFEYRDGVLFCEGVDLTEVAGRAGTPCYVYSAGALRRAYGVFEEGLAGAPHLVCFAVKANGNLAVLRLLAEAGAGFDIVSGGELFRVLKAGADPAKVVFSGVGKTREEIEAALEAGIHSFNCESEAELLLLSSLAQRTGRTARAAIRVNPDVDAATHPYISTGLKRHKFGIDIAEAEELYARAAALPGLALEGASCHIGSQLLDVAPLIEAAERMAALVERLRARGIAVRFLDLGGGLGVPYRKEDSWPDVARYLAAVRGIAERLGVELLLEPGRFIAGPAGALLARVLYRKSGGGKEFLIVDASMTELIRPALYEAHHEMLPLRQTGRGTFVADIVGPVCESSDFLAEEREIENLLPGDFLAVMTAGAYGFVMASNYNARPRPCEVLVDGDTWRVVRQRERLEDLVRGEEA
ncbi:MAG: diaminopimelate decarboxylase [Bryobacteraceae bacterium]|nr:MAG: diaminopimelate decarboxylase [Bryobacteraceae bacterium]